MPKFCKFCGSPLEEWQACACQGTAPEPAAQQLAALSASSAPKEPTMAKTTIANIFPFFKAYISAPEATTKAAVAQNGIGLATVLAAMFGLAVFAFIYTFFLRFALVAEGLIAAIAERLPMFSALPIDSSVLRGVEISLPLLRSLIYCMILSAAMVLLTTLVMLISARLLGTVLSLKASFIAGSVSLIFPCLFMVLAVLCLFISFVLTLFALLLAVLAWCICIYSAARALALKQGTGGFIVGIVALLAVSVIIGGFACGKTVTATAQNMIINGTPISDILEEFSGLIEDF